jgi:hypothetical protein
MNKEELAVQAEEKKRLKDSKRQHALDLQKQKEKAKEKEFKKLQQERLQKELNLERRLAEQKRQRELRSQMKDEKLRQAIAFTQQQANAFNEYLEKKQMSAEERVEMLK